MSRGQKCYDVFISFSSKDQKVAEGVCGYLEGNGIRCFVSYRDIPKGTIWADEIFNAISRSKSMIAVFSKNFNDSEHTKREISLASEAGIPILPFRIRPDQPTGGIGFYLSNLNWIDAFPEPDKYFGKLLNDVKQIISSDEETANISMSTSEELEEDVAPKPSQNTEKTFLVGDEKELEKKLYEMKKKRIRKHLSFFKKAVLRWKHYLIGIPIAILVILLSWFLLRNHKNQPVAPTTPLDTTIVQPTLEDSTAAIEEIEIVEDSSTVVLLQQEVTEPEIDFEHASLATLEEYAEKGNAAAQYWLGEHYYAIKRTGNVDKAVSWWEKSAQTGFIPAINRIAWCYYYNVHYPKDYSAAVQYYIQTANMNSPEGMYYLAMCYYNGYYEGQSRQKQKFKEAVEWLNKASDLGFAPAQCYLGKMYFNNEFGYKKPLYGKGFSLLKKAADQDFAEAQFFVAECYRLGRGTKKDLKKAKQYYNKAKQNGYQK